MTTASTVSDIYTRDHPQIRRELSRLGTMAYTERNHKGLSDNRHIAEIDRLTDELVKLGACRPRDSMRE